MFKIFRKAQRYRFNLPSLQSPTYYNLAQFLQAKGWKKTPFKALAHFTERNFEFDILAAETLEFKHLLAKLVTRYCPEVMPETYRINDSNWSEVLNCIAEKYYFKNKQLQDQVDDLLWILKPALLNNGQHIKLFTRLSELEQHYLMAQRLGGEHVLQHYLTYPHLLPGPQAGHKYSIRLFAVITNYAGVYLYPEGYFNVARYPYQALDFSDLSSHLTNEHLKDPESNVVQIPTERSAEFTAIYPQLKIIVEKVIQALQQSHPQAFVCKKQRTLAIYGFDFLIDHHRRAWLLEANHGPCFPTNPDHPLQQNLYTPFWQAFIQSFVLPIALNKTAQEVEYKIFEPVIF